MQRETSQNEDTAVVALVKDTKTDDTINNQNNDYTNVELKTEKPTPFDVDRLEASLAEISNEFSQVQQRLLNDLLQLDNTSGKALIDAKEVLKKYFKNVSAKQCDSLYIAYYTYADLLRQYIYNDECYSQVADNFYKTYDNFDELPKVYQPIVKEPNSHGITLEDIGEGCAELSFYPDYYYEIFKPYTTEATREYLKLMAFERANEFLFDAAVYITWEELADRIINFEEYLDKYPNSIFAGNIREKYNSYTSLLLIGCDNTPTFDWLDEDNRKLNADVLESYHKIIETYSHRRLAETLTEYLSLPEESEMLQNEEINEFIRQFNLDDSANEY
ncbi:MAG: hypothetical protein LBG19_06100 [Prevotellaceae bacterium]|nr:hypothetical protein [Prevotellaceae bacterium]